MPQRNWLITGVSSGFGCITTEQLLARGDRLWLAKLDLSEIEKRLATNPAWRCSASMS